VRDEDYTGTKKSQNAWKSAERARKRKSDADESAKLVKTAKKMKLVTEQDRRLDFQKATLLGADFVCICCHYPVLY